MLRAQAVILSLILLSPCGLAHAAPALDPASVNAAGPPANPVPRGKRPDPAVIKAQVLLDRAGFSPGEIDGRVEENTRKAIVAFESEGGLPVDGKLTRGLWAALTGTSDEPVLTDYAIAREDVAGPFLQKLPAKMEEMKGLDHLSYTSPRQALAEKFHMSEALLAALNPGKDLGAAGTMIVVANVGMRPSAKVTRIEIDKPGHLLRAYAGDMLLAVDPASIGSTEKPAPSGTFKVTSVTQNPTYRYDPAYAFKGVKTTKPFTIKPGPNNPVGTVWIGLTAKGYGIHGTPAPGNVGKTASHGCIRLTNWDAEALAGMVSRGVQVDFLDTSNAPQPVAAPAEKSGRGGKGREKRRR